MILLHRIAGALLWLLAAVGVACALVWVATAIGLVKPLVVISGSMEPQIMTGDLVVAVPADVAELRAGDVATLPSPLDGTLVTHRVESIVLEGDAYRIATKGDANEFGDPVDSIVPVGDRVWAPAAVLPGAGETVMRLSTPAVALPLVIGIVALVGIVWLAPAGRAPARRDEPVAADPDRDPAVAAELEEVRG